MSLILSWPCQECGVMLSETEFLITRKYCDRCRKERANKRRRTNKPRKFEQLIYLLTTNKKATIGEMISFVDTTKESLSMMLTELRKKGHQIKYSKLDGFYYYGGLKKVNTNV